MTGNNSETTRNDHVQPENVPETTRNKPEVPENDPETFKMSGNDRKRPETTGNDWK